ncbi:MAG: DUF4268 domain-containing protein [Candidatus Choladocola sp.]|nr:DUF4268 domain-containing protein [Candidatus Choladocola sp.]
MAVKTKLGTMTQITNLRDVWPNEATDFTPWLAENISLLSDVTGLSLEVIEQESPVGSFSLDVLAQDTDTDTYTVIENQLEDTNHDHLGKLLTYAAGKDAKNIIWIVKAAREEHKAAIEWLNNNTVDGVGFFLVEIQLWSVDGSAPAPRFNVVEQPNDWVKIAKRPSGPQGGAAVQFKYDYWTSFNDYAFANVKFASMFKQRKASSDHWYSMSIGSSYAHISLLVNTKTDMIAVELSIPDNKALYDKLEQNKEDIEKAVGVSLDWRRLDDKKACRILLEKKVPLKETADWPSQFDWFMENAMAFKKAFSPFL